MHLLKCMIPDRGLTKVIKLGVIGSSDGNGHPFSWSAIFNGYNSIEMENCGYPVIHEYLSRRKFPDEYLCHQATVHGVWTQNYTLSQKISKAALIDTVYTNLPHLIQDVDAILLARDDSENHLKFLREIIKHDKPVYIDKPIATNQESLSSIFNLYADSPKFFSCSAFRFHSQLQKLAVKIRENPSDVEVNGSIPKSWEKYSIHLLDPLIELIPEQVQLLNYSRAKCGDCGVAVDLQFENNIRAKISTTGNEHGMIEFIVRIDGKAYSIDFSDTFSLFRSALSYFIENNIVRTSKPNFKNYKRVVELISCGLK